MNLINLLKPPPFCISARAFSPSGLVKNQNMDLEHSSTGFFLLGSMAAAALEETIGGPFPLVGEVLVIEGSG